MISLHNERVRRGRDIALRTGRPSSSRARSLPTNGWKSVWVGLVSCLSFACSGVPASAGPFDADRVIRDAVAQCAFGPRVPGTEAHVQTKDWIVGELRALGMEVDVQAFEARLPLTGEVVEAWNIWGVPDPFAEGDVILLSAHWDTRPFADEEPEGEAARPFLGANDGAASVAFVMEAIRAAKGTQLEGRLAVAFFDAEDSGVSGDADSWCLGSQYAADHPPAWLERMVLGINVDMVAHSGVELRKEGFSLEAAPEAVNRLWRIGGDLAPRIFIDEPRPQVIDDHVPFIRKGYAYIDLIGLPNLHWHRVSDRPENLNAASIRGVGAVLMEFLRQELAPPPAAGSRPRSQTRN